MIFFGFSCYGHIILPFNNGASLLNCSKITLCTCGVEIHELVLVTVLNSLEALLPLLSRQIIFGSLIEPASNGVLAWVDETVTVEIVGEVRHDFVAALEENLGLSFLLGQLIYCLGAHVMRWVLERVAASWRIATEAQRLER